MAHAAHSSGIGMAAAVASGADGIGGRAIGAVRGFGAGVVNSGCVFVIFARVGGAVAGSGSMLMRAVSCFGRFCEADPA
jgi:hypothetical protein